MKFSCCSAWNSQGQYTHQKKEENPVTRGHCVLPAMPNGTTRTPLDQLCLSYQNIYIYLWSWCIETIFDFAFLFCIELHIVTKSIILLILNVLGENYFKTISLPRNHTVGMGIALPLLVAILSKPWGFLHVDPLSLWSFFQPYDWSMRISVQVYGGLYKQQYKCSKQSKFW